MENEKMPKYRILLGQDSIKLESEINDLVEQGYKLHTFNSVVDSDSEFWDIAVMSLSASSKYDDISNLRDIQPGEVDALLAEGWTVTDSYSKFIRMVKKKEAK